MIEFDFEKFELNEVFLNKVCYKEVIPAFSEDKLVGNISETEKEYVVSGMTLNKSNCWEYEDEWRSIRKNDGKALNEVKIVGCELFKSIYLGLNISDEFKSNVLSVSDGLDIYEAYLTNDRYDIQYRLLK